MEKAPKPGTRIACSENSAENGLFGTQSGNWQAKTTRRLAR